MKTLKGLYFVFNVVFILSIGYLLAPLPSAKSITREWLVRIEKQLHTSVDSFDKKLQLASLTELINDGKTTFTSKEKKRGRALLSLIQKKILVDMETGRIDQIIGVMSKQYFDQMEPTLQNTIFSQGKLAGSFYLLANKSIDDKRVDPGIEVLNLDHTQLPFDAYYVVTSRSGKKFLLSVEEDKGLELQFLLMTHPESKKKWRQVRPLLPKVTLPKKPTVKS